MKTEIEKDADRWREYCRMMAEHDNDAIEAFGAMIPDGTLSKDMLDLAMDAWLAQRAG